jgi:hypothetical protein
MDFKEKEYSDRRKIVKTFTIILVLTTILAIIVKCQN